MKKLLAILGILALVCTVVESAEEYDTLKLKNGKTLYRCTVVGWSPTAAVIEHYQGFDSVEWPNLPAVVLEDLYSKQGTAIRKSTIQINLKKVEETDGSFEFSSPFRDGLIKISINNRVLYLSDPYSPLTVRCSYSHDSVTKSPVSNFLIFSDRIYKIETDFPTPSIIKNYLAEGIGTGTVSISIEDIAYNLNIEVIDHRPKPKIFATRALNSESPTPKPQRVQGSSETIDAFVDRQVEEHWRPMPGGNSKEDAKILSADILKARNPQELEAALRKNIREGR
jgi:hypothetical protein